MLSRLQFVSEINYKWVIEVLSYVTRFIDTIIIYITDCYVLKCFYYLTVLCNQCFNIKFISQFYVHIVKVSF